LTRAIGKGKFKVKTYWGEWIYSSTHSLNRHVVSFRRRPLFSQGKSPRYPSDRGVGGTQSRSGRGGENSQPPPKINPYNRDRPARSQSLYRLSYGKANYETCVSCCVLINCTVKICSYLQLRTEFEADSFCSGQSFLPTMKQTEFSSNHGRTLHTNYLPN